MHMHSISYSSLCSVPLLEYHARLGNRNRNATAANMNDTSELSHAVVIGSLMCDLWIQLIYASVTSLFSSTLTLICTYMYVHVIVLLLCLALIVKGFKWVHVALIQIWCFSTLGIVL